LISNCRILHSKRHTHTDFLLVVFKPGASRPVTTQDVESTSVLLVSPAARENPSHTLLGVIVDARLIVMGHGFHHMWGNDIRILKKSEE
jgi:hypothetical protein